LFENIDFVDARIRTSTKRDYVRIGTWDGIRCRWITECSWRRTMFRHVMTKNLLDGLLQNKGDNGHILLPFESSFLPDIEI
jgi:hypothetical protein